jgi:hypothetical protein
MKREMLAQRMREMMRASVQLSDEEMWREYQRTHDQMAVKYVRFNLASTATSCATTTPPRSTPGPRPRRGVNRSTSAAARACAPPAEIRVRHILVKFPDDATDAQKAEVRARRPRPSAPSSSRAATSCASRGSTPTTRELARGRRARLARPTPSYVAEPFRNAADRPRSPTASRP